MASVGEGPKRGGSANRAAPRKTYAEAPARTSTRRKAPGNIFGPAAERCTLGIARKGLGEQCNDDRALRRRSDAGRGIEKAMASSARPKGDLRGIRGGRRGAPTELYAELVCARASSLLPDTSSDISHNDGQSGATMGARARYKLPGWASAHLHTPAGPAPRPGTRIHAFACLIGHGEKAGGWHFGAVCAARSAGNAGGFSTWAAPSSAAGAATSADMLRAPAVEAERPHVVAGPWPLPAW